MTDWITSEQMRAIPAAETSDRAALVSAPRVSVLMMTRNHEQYLRQAVESVLAQHCTFGFELLIGEDLSSDATRRVALELQQAHPSLVRLFTAEGNVGITANFLRLAVHARGEYLAFLEGDDYWTCPEKLQRQVEMLDRHPEFAWCAARTANRMQWLPAQPSYGLDELLLRYVVHTSTVLFRAALVRRYPAFPDRVCWESMLLAYLTEQGRCGFIDEEMSYYRRHAGGLWHNAERIHRIQMSRDCIDAMNEYFGGRYRKELADREVWIYAMETRPNPDLPIGGQWRFAAQVARQALHRTLGGAPGPCLGLVLRAVALPALILHQRARRALGLRTRLAQLFGGRER